MLCLIVVIFTINAVTDGFDHKDPSISTDANVQFALKTKEKYLRRNGTSYIFDCSVENYKAVSENIEWVKDGETIPYYNGMVKVQYQGERNSTLVVPNATNRDAGLYTCTVVNFLRKEISRTFELPPTGKPFIYVPIGKEDLTIEEGSNAKFKCVVSGNFTAWRWLYNGNLVTTTVRKKLRPAYFLKIRKVRKDDEGIYVCSVTNKFGTSQKFYTLKVKSKKRKAPKKPQLVKNYTSLPEIVMNDLDVDCSVVGALPMNVTWYKDGIPISSLQRKKGFIFRENKQILRLETLLPEDRANYTCYFQNRYGSLKHTIEVEPIEKAHTAPYFVGKKNQETPYYVRPDQDLNVTVEVVVFNTAHFQLLLHYNLTNSTSNQTEQGLRVLSTPRDIILLRPETNRVANDAFRYKLNFKFKNLTKEDFAFYSIMAGNTFGYDVYQFQLADENERVAPITDADRNSQKKSMYKTSTFIIIISLSIGFVVIFVIACILWRHKSKRSFTNNNKFFWKETNVELVHLNIEDSATVTTASRRMKYSSSRLSSCQTEKEYFSNLSVDPNWEVDFENIEFRGFIGEGAFGRVMLANVHGLPETKEPTVAAVKMLKEDATEHELKDLLSEMQVMKNIGKHINIVNLLGVSTQQGKLCVIIEYCLFGNLRNYLKERRPTVAPNPPPIEQLCLFHLTSFCLQVAKGMEYLASQKCVHRDIAARNILVSDNHIVKIADFGLARDVQLTDYYRKCTDGRLPVKWMAMEALFDRVYTVQSDIWSFGILAWEVVTLGGSPYPGVPLEKLFDLLKQGYRMEKPVNCTENMYKLMLKCWKEEPRKRPSFTELIDDLENMITDVSGIEYLDLQPPIVGLHCAESVSSNSQGQSCGRTSVNSADVFEDNVADDDTVQADKGEEDRLLNESQVAADT